MVAITMDFSVPILPEHFLLLLACILTRHSLVLPVGTILERSSIICKLNMQYETSLGFNNSNMP